MYKDKNLFCKPVSFLVRLVPNGNGEATGGGGGGVHGDFGGNSICYSLSPKGDLGEEQRMFYQALQGSARRDR